MHLVWSSSSVKELHRAVEKVMVQEMEFEVICVGNEWVEGVELSWR
jgi:hypothetical protein